MSGNPLCACAGLATLNELEKPGTYSKLYGLADRFEKGIQDIAASRSIPIQLPGEGPVRSILFTEHEITSYASTLKADRKKGYQLGIELIKRGIFNKPADKMYISTAHSKEDIDKTIQTTEQILSSTSLLNAA
jgi:glutamate-1-semialdehyde 2,1-aminomutase